MKRQKEERESQEQTLVVNINLTRGLVALLTLALLTAAVLGYLAWGHERVTASSPQAPMAESTGMRKYYLTIAAYHGNEPTGAGVCASGYHFASLWEIL
jgi:hypothetical protein